MIDTGVETGEVIETAMVEKLTRAELDVQVATAKRWPRSLTAFSQKVREMACLNEQVAEECSYAIPREGKTIEGPSARFAEIVANAWGNCRAGARTIDDSGDFVTAQGVFIDSQVNLAITYEVRRRIVDKRGRRFSPDMIAVTANAACSIALRNAVLKGVPKAFWGPAWDASRAVIAGSTETLTKRRDAALVYLKDKWNVSAVRVLGALKDSSGSGLRGVDDMTTEHLLSLRGIITALKENEITVDEAFPDPTKVVEEEKVKKGLAALTGKMAEKQAVENAVKRIEGEVCSVPDCTGEVVLIENKDGETTRYCFDHAPKKE